MKYADYNERKRHGSVEFPIQHYYVDKNHPEYLMNTHWHGEFEIIRVKNGSFTVHLNNTEYLLSGDDILLVDCGCLHTGRPTECVYECLVFDLNMLKKSRDGVAKKYIDPIINSHAEVINLIDPKDTELRDTINLLFSVMSEKRHLFELEVYSLLYKMFGLFYCCNYITPRDRSIQTGPSRTVTKIVNYIEENFTEQITLDRLCNLTGLSKKYLCRLFKEYTDKTIVGYLNELRIENACYEIREGGESITSAAFNSGFNDLSYFCKVFKQYKGITPNEYKKLKS